MDAATNVKDAPAQPAQPSLAATILQACSDGLPGGCAHQTYDDLGNGATAARFVTRAPLAIAGG
jgi:hypothetical protein